MSKEAYKGDKCACGQTIAFPEYHLPHCRLARQHATRVRERDDKKVAVVIEQELTKFRRR